MPKFIVNQKSEKAFKACLLGIPTLSVLCMSLLILDFRAFAVDQPNQSPLPETVEFNRDIRPILSNNCFYCHGPDKSHREAELRLDTEKGLVGDKTHKGVVTAGNPDKSKLIQRLLSADPEKHMPPPESAKELSAREIEMIKLWVAQGARYEGHWAFQPVRKPALARNSASANDSKVIDEIVRQKRVENKLTGSAEADRITLLRRLYFDTVGLPPTSSEVKSFLSDKSSNAYEKQVDQLLASPNYGERMAMWWLDLVRYADTVGYHGDQEMSVSPFRQYVIESFNRNKPFDQFTQEQIGGDLMATPNIDQKIASGYNRLGMMSAEGGVQDKEYLAKYISERVRNVSGTWLGVTIGCAECHDHKFDPFTTREFYQMEAFFADIKERGLYSGANSDGNWGPFVKVPNKAQQSALTDLNQKISLVDAAYKKVTPEIAKSQAQWEKDQPLWTVLKPELIKSQAGSNLTLKDDGSILASGTNPATDTYTLEIGKPVASVTTIRLEVLPDDSLPKKGPGRAGNGNFVLSEFVLKCVLKNGETKTIPIQSAKASYEQTGAADKNPYGKWAIAAAIDNDVKGKTWGWGIMEQAGKPNSADFIIAPDTIPKETVKWVVELHQNLDNPTHTIGKFRLSATDSKNSPAGSPALQPSIALILATSPDKRTEAQKSELTGYYRTIAPELATVRQELATLEASKKKLESEITSSLVTESVTPRMVKVLPRGNWMDDSGDIVQPGYPAVLNASSKSINQAPAATRLNRLDLAKWITSNDNPLTARVFTNRIWKLYFGEALSRKVDDLGAQGKAPTHPELLDFLAIRFVESGWDVKLLLKSILMSDTYKQSSTVSPDSKERDPYNFWISHQGRFRLDAELVRDNALAVSGLLVNKIGGTSVKPYQPPGYWSYLNFPTREWQNGKNEELYRRGLYTHWQRQYLHPSLLAFDAPSREECTSDRARSNTPLQSLVLLNDPSYVEAARAFAELVLENGGKTTATRLQMIYERALSRPVKAEESAVLEALLARSFAEYKSNPKAVSDLLSVGVRPVPKNLDPAELAAWTAITRTILNLHETMTRN